MTCYEVINTLLKFQLVLFTNNIEILTSIQAMKLSLAAILDHVLVKIGSNFHFVGSCISTIV